MKEEHMKKKTMAALFLAGAMSVGVTTAFAQEGQHTGRKSGGDAPAAAESTQGNASSIPAGQGGTAGTHPTGANVGPARAGDVKGTGN
jgi:hypothetical protein